MFRTVTSASSQQYLQYGTRQGGANIFHICWIENMPVTSANCRCTALGLGWRGMANALTVLTPERLIEKPEIDFDSGGGCINEPLENVPNQQPLSCPHLRNFYYPQPKTLCGKKIQRWFNKFLSSGNHAFSIFSWVLQKSACQSVRLQSTDIGVFHLSMS